MIQVDHDDIYIYILMMMMIMIQVDHDYIYIYMLIDMYENVLNPIDCTYVRGLCCGCN